MAGRRFNLRLHGDDWSAAQDHPYECSHEEQDNRASRVIDALALLPSTATWSALRCGVSTVVTKHSSGKLLGNSGHVLALESTHLELKCRGHAQFAPRPGYATCTVRRAT